MNPTEDGMEPKTSDEDVIPPQIEELLRSRSTLVEWLERLEERKDDVRPAVYDKVQDDYRGRLGEVEGHLSEHRSDLERALDERREAVRELEEERDERAAELEEVELRHEVGELDEGEWEEESGELRDALDELEDGLEGERAAVERLEEVLDELAGLEGGAVAGAEEPAVGAGRTDPEPGPAPAGGTSSGERGTAAELGPELDGAPGPEDEDAAIEGGDGWPAPELGEPEEPAPASDGSEEDVAGSEEDVAATPEAGRGAGADGEETDADDFDELDFLESLSLDEPDSLDTLGMDLDEEESASDGEGSGEETGEGDREGPGG